MTLSEMDRERLLTLARAFNLDPKNSVADARGWWLHMADDRSDADPLQLFCEPLRPLTVMANAQKVGAIGGAWATGPLPTTMQELGELSRLLRRIAQTREAEPAGGGHGP